MRSVLHFAALAAVLGAAIAGKAKPKPSDTYSAELSGNATAEVPVGPHVIFHTASNADQTTATLEIGRHPVAIDVDLTRYATVLVPTIETRIVLIHECFASNEDRI